MSFVLTEYSVLFGAGFVLSASQYHAKGRRQMMAVSVVSALCFAGYYFSVSAVTGGAACLIAALGSCLQWLFPERALKQTVCIRLAVAIVLSAAAAIFLVSQASDVLPLCALVFARLAEAQSCQQRIRVGLLFSQLAWLIYAFNQGLIFLYILDHIGLFSNMVSIWRRGQERKEQSIGVEARCYSAMTNPS